MQFAVMQVLHDRLMKVHQNEHPCGARLTGMQFAVVQMLHDGSELPGKQPQPGLLTADLA